MDYNNDMKAFCAKNKKYLTFLNLQGALMKGKKPNASFFSGKHEKTNLYLTKEGYNVAKKVIVKKVRKAAKKK